MRVVITASHLLLQTPLSVGNPSPCSVQYVLILSGSRFLSPVGTRFAAPVCSGLGTPRIAVRFAAPRLYALLSIISHTVPYFPLPPPLRHPPSIVCLTSPCLLILLGLYENTIE
jgi:hypothetical protein